MAKCIDYVPQVSISKRKFYWRR